MTDILRYQEAHFAVKNIEMWVFHPSEYRKFDNPKLNYRIISFTCKISKLCRVDLLPVFIRQIFCGGGAKYPLVSMQIGDLILQGDQALPSPLRCPARLPVRVCLSACFQLYEPLISMQTGWYTVSYLLSLLLYLLLLFGVFYFSDSTRVAASWGVERP